MNATGVQATVNYIANRPPAGEPLLRSFTEDKSLSTVQTQPMSVFVTDARRAESEGRQFDLDTEGFGLFAHATGIADFDQIEEDAEVDKHHVEAVVARLQAITGAALVVSMTQPKKRYGEGAHDKLVGLANAQPARHPHVDYSEDAAVDAAATFCPDHATRYGRYVLYNVWRSTSAPPQDIPLALCAANSVSPQDEVPVISVTRTRKLGDVDVPIFGYEANPAHRWYYYRDMTPDEILVFKAFDSDPALACRVPHTAFSDPSCPPDTPPRSSVEQRLIAFFE